MNALLTHILLGSEITCCTRCQVKQPRVCCGTCRRSAFPSYTLESLPTKTKSKRQIKIKEYMMGSRDSDLRQALQNWRLKELKKNGWGGDHFFGSNRILPMSILNRVVDLAHECRLTSVQSLVEQTSWREANKYGEEILELVRIHAPPPITHTPTPSFPSQSSPVLGNVSNSNMQTTTPNKEDFTLPHRLRRTQIPD
jgi:hypothetical protein